LKNPDNIINWQRQKNVLILKILYAHAKLSGGSDEFFCSAEGELSHKF
jgi:hypothetical protein